MPDQGWASRTESVCCRRLLCSNLYNFTRVLGPPRDRMASRNTIRLCRGILTGERSTYASFSVAAIWSYGSRRNPIEPRRRRQNPQATNSWRAVIESAGRSKYGSQNRDRMRFQGVVRHNHLFDPIFLSCRRAGDASSLQLVRTCPNRCGRPMLTRAVLHLARQL